MAGNACCFKSTSLNIFKNTEYNYWVKCLFKDFQQGRLRYVLSIVDKKQREYFRKPYLGDHWSGKVVPEKE